MPKPTVYIETSIPSYYFATRRTVHAISWRKITRAWWTQYGSVFDLVTSSAVLVELEAGPEFKSGPCLELLAGVPLLENSPDVLELARTYLRLGLLPKNANVDAVHLACASIHRIDYLLTWNCKHLANVSIQSRVRQTNQRLRVGTPVVTTPLTLIPVSNE